MFVRIVLNVNNVYRAMFIKYTTIALKRESLFYWLYNWLSCKSLKVCVTDIFLFLDSTNMLGSGNRSFNSTQPELKFAHGQESVVVLLSIRKHGNIALVTKTYVQGNTLCMTHFNRQSKFGPNKGITYANSVHIVITLILC